MKRSALLAVLVMFCGSVLAFGTGATDTKPEEAAQPMVASGKFNEAPMLAAMVAAGELPPLQDRLPEEPAVLWPFAVDNPEIGQYGGTIQVFSIDNNPWGDLLEETERGGYIFRTNEDAEIIPDLIRDYDVSADEKDLHSPYEGRNEMVRRRTLCRRRFHFHVEGHGAPRRNQVVVQQR